MDLFQPVVLGELGLNNRIVMAPMTRSRAGAGAVPTELTAQYYAQRASAGLIVTEGIAPCADGLGYCRTPGIYNRPQIDGWRVVTDAVHAAGGRIVAQLMHVGRVASHYNKPEGSRTIAPSALVARGQIYTDAQGMQLLDEPEALALQEIPEVVEAYRQATANAFDADFDGVELHCASGYLPAQFLSTGTNQRDDEYGGSVDNRCRFPLQLLRAMASVNGAGRVGMRICPDNPFNDLYDAEPEQTFARLLAGAAELELAYLHVIRLPAGRVDNIALGKRYFPDNMIGNDSYDLAEATEAVTAGEMQAVSFGRHYIGNPDLVARWRQGLPLSPFDPATLYTEGAEGYISYAPAAQ